ncbi:retrotransposon protein, putative, ty1-copia subclass [Tanacetum coccineum]
MSTKVAVVKSDGCCRQQNTASNTELESEIEIIPDMSDTMTAIEKKGEFALVSRTRLDLFLDQLRSDVIGTIIVMIGRVWDISALSDRYLSTDFVVSDAEGQMIHCSARASVAHNFLRLSGGGIYSVKLFAVKPNKEEYRVIKDDNFMLEFDGSMNFRKVSVKADGFVRYPLKLLDLNAIEPADNKYLIGRTNHLKSGFKNLDFHLANHMAVNQSNAMGKHRGVYLSSTSSTMILDDVEIPAIKALKDSNSGMELKNPYMPIDLTRPSATFHCTMTIDGVKTKTGWNFPSCCSKDCKKSVTRQKGYFYYESCNRRKVTLGINEYRYKLELGTSQTVIVMFNETATALVGCSAGSLIDIEDEMIIVERKLFVIEQPISLASPTDSEYLCSGMRYMIHNKVACLMLGNNFHYAPSILRGVVSVHRLVENGFVQCFTDFGISVSKNNVHYFNAIPRYPKEIMGYYFYFPLENKIVVARYAEFFEKNLITQEVSGRAEGLEEIQDEDTSPSEITSEIPMEVEEVEEHSIGDLNEPTSYKAAMLDPKSGKWINAMNVEMQSMIDNMVWVLVDLPPNCKTVGSKWLFKKKTDMDGNVHTYKISSCSKGLYSTLRG